MGPFTGLTVEVISEGKSLQLYDDPDEEPAHDPRTHQRYVEAVTGATFEIRVSLQKEFKLGSLTAKDGVNVDVFYDDQSLSWCQDFAVNDLRYDWSRGRRSERTFGSITNYDKDSQQWMNGATTFCALDTKDTANTTASVDQIGDLGRIKVVVERVYRTKLAISQPVSKVQRGPMTEVSEKMLKGKAITNNIRSTNATVAKEPLYSEYDTTPMHGVNGQPLTTIIFYRPRREHRQEICDPQAKCSPRYSADAGLHPSISISRVRDLSSARTQRGRPRAKNTRFKGKSFIDTQWLRMARCLHETQAQLAVLEGDGNIKAEGSNAKRRIKREIEDTEDLQITETRSTERTRHSGPIETVDLTED